MLFKHIRKKWERAVFVVPTCIERRFSLRKSLCWG